MNAVPPLPSWGRVPGTAPPCLIARDGFGRSTVIALAGPVVLGRARSAEAKPAEDPAISRFHCLVFPGRMGSEGATAWYLADLGSRNGTYLNGRRVRRPVCLRHGDRFRLGRTLQVLAVLETGDEH
jgi:predicted component of type VI protein secretion system